MKSRRFVRLAYRAGIVLGAMAPLSAAAAADSSADLVRLVSPAPGSTLAAGSTVTLEWQPRPGRAAMPHAEEWEAFLSLDGGRTFLTRLTPHLELDMRRVSVRLPELPSDDARLLLRFGDERVEREQVVPGRYRIAAAATPAATWRLPRVGRGEPARPGAPGVLVWVEGSRDGEGWEEVEGGSAGDVWEPALVPGAVRLRGMGPIPAPAPKVSRAVLAAFDPRVVEAVTPPTVGACGAPAPSLAVLCRRNV